MSTLNQKQHYREGLTKFKEKLLQASNDSRSKCANLASNCNGEIKHNTSQVFCPQKYKIASDMFLAIPGKVSQIGQYSNTEKKSWTHLAGEGDWRTSLTIQHTEETLPFIDWPLYESRVTPPWLHPFWSLRSTDAHNLCSLGQPQPFARFSVTS